MNKKALVIGLAAVGALAAAGVVLWRKLPTIKLALEDRFDSEPDDWAEPNPEQTPE